MPTLTFTSSGTATDSKERMKSQWFDSVPDYTEILPKTSQWLDVQKGDTIGQSCIIRTDGAIELCTLTYWGNTSKAHHAAPATVEEVGKDEYQIATSYTFTTDDKLRLFDIYQLKVTGSTYVSFTAPRVWLDSVGGGNGIINPTVNLLHNTEPTSLGNLSTTTWAIGSGGNGVGKVIHVNESSFGAPARFWIDNNNGGNRDFFQKLDSDLAGQYTFAVWAWAADDNADKAIIRVFSEDGNNTLLYSDTFTVNKTAQRISLAFNIDRPCRVQFGMTGTGSMLFCQPMLNAGPIAMPYVLGI